MQSIGKVGIFAVCAGIALACGQEQNRKPGAAAQEPVQPPGDEAAAMGSRLSGEALYSQSNEELIIRDFFGDRRDGIFLDVGCASPVRDSNTFYLEKHLGWSGIGIDALPEYATPWKRKRPRSKFFSYLVTDHAETVEPFYRAELKGISAAQSPVLDPTGQEVEAEEIQVPTITLTKLLEDNGVSSIDFLSMDIEGAEPAALAGFDIERFKPRLVCIEAKPQNRLIIAQYFTEHGYVQIKRYLEHDEVNHYFTPGPAD